MASDQQLVDRLSKLLASRPGVVPRRMFGGICFMLNGNMCVGVHTTSLIIRVGVEQADQLLSTPHVKPMDLTGKVMKGWAEVLSEGLKRDKDLRRYAELALDFVSTLEPKIASTPAKRPHAKSMTG